MQAMGHFLDAVADANMAVSGELCAPIPISRPPVGDGWEIFAARPPVEEHGNLVKEIFGWCNCLLRRSER